MNAFKEINRNRLIKTFLELVRIDSLSRKEGKIAKHLTSVLKSVGATLTFDGAGKITKGETGNLIAKFPGTGSGPGAPFLLCAHMDTVGPGEGIKPVVKKKRIRSDGRTILGADCKSGIAVIIEILRVLKEKRLPHPPIEAVFTVSEEIGLLGAKNLDYSKLKARSGIILDSESPHEVTVKAPAADTMEIRVHGYEAHAGMCPEKGLSAIKIAAKAIAKMRLGRIDSQTTANIGVINGGNATNVVTPLVTLKAEARSHNPSKLKAQTRHMRNTLLDAVRASRVVVDGKTINARLDFKARRDFPNLVVPKNNPVLKSLFAVAKKSGIAIKSIACGGGSDVNIFYGHGIHAVNLGTGMWEVHTVREYLDLEDFFTCAGLTLGAVITAETRG